MTMARRYWLQALGWVACIYITLPIVRPICEFLRKAILFNLVVNTTILLVIGILIIFFCVRRQISKTSLLFFVFLAVISYGSIASFVKIPEEKIHFLEYGLLAFLLFRALRVNKSEFKSYLWALILTLAFGWADEGIQHLLPNRYYDTRDVVFNLLGGVLGLSFTFILRRDSQRKEKKHIQITSP